jgi:hypothetical protein
LADYSNFEAKKKSKKEINRRKKRNKKMVDKKNIENGTKLHIAHNEVTKVSSNEGNINRKP